MQLATRTRRSLFGTAFVITAAATLAGCTDSPPGPQIPSFESAELQQGRAVWMQVCRNCHLMGVAGAPSISDYPAWQDRISTERSQLYDNAINGIGSDGAWTMPPRGGNASLSDGDVKRAVDFTLAAVEALKTR
jgi:cytochrome c5